ncbi:hypothetical protein Tco_1248657, partial [Tanacetum coccineum]
MVDAEKLKGPQDKPEGGSSSNELNFHVNDPSYIHANDTNGTSLITFKLTGTENYKVWYVTVNLALHTKDKSLILTTEPLPDVKSAFATLSKDESHRQSHFNAISSETRPFAFAAKSNNWAADELVGYPPRFKKRGNNQTVNNVNTNKTNVTNIAGLNSKLSDGDWLGHPSDQVLTVLKDKLYLENDDNGGHCEVCYGAKQTRKPFPL